MPAVLRTCGLAGLLALLAWMPKVQAQQRDLEGAMAAVLRVHGDDCATQSSKVASGFLWRAPDSVVTALHAVASCQSLSVYSERAKETRRATVSKVLRSADLALLSLDRPFELTPAMPSDRPTRVGDALKALGYTYDAPTLTDRDLKIAAGNSRLRDMLPSQVADEIRQAGAPDLELTILRLNGTLLPGLSGAPIIDDQDRVVGIGSGGIEGGAAAISWGIPIAYLGTLESSTEAPQASFQQATSLYAADMPAASSSKVRCGDIVFTLMRTRPFERLVETTDDPVAVHQVVNFLQVAPDILADLHFDIWVDEASGATIALPAGSKPVAGDGACIVGNDVGLDVVMTGNVVASPMEAQTRSEEFEAAVSQMFPGIFWQIDPAWSYPFPHVNGKDGMTVNRKSFNGQPPAYGTPGAYATDVLISRGDTFIALAVVDADIDFALAAACQYDPWQPPCEHLRQKAANWAPFALATLLSTFPPY